MGLTIHFLEVMKYFIEFVNMFQKVFLIGNNCLHLTFHIKYSQSIKDGFKICL